MHESKHVSQGGSVGRAGRRTADCRGHRRDSGVGVGRPEEAISRLTQQEEQQQGSSSSILRWQEATCAAPGRGTLQRIQLVIVLSATLIHY
jgi:hypothetical protein